MKNHTLLFVDDEEKVLKLLDLTFSDRGCQILTASDGPQALELLEQQTVSLVLSDNEMPGLTGVELLSEVRRRWPDCARVLLTGFADIEVTMAAINQGWVHRFITKPWDEAHLTRTVDELIEGVELKNENRRLSELTQEQNEELRQLNADLDRRVAERTAELEQKNRELKALNARIKRGILGSVQMFSMMLETYDEALGGHSTRVASLSGDLALRIGLNEEQVEEIEIAARLHDVGLVCLPEYLAKTSEHISSNLTEQAKALYRRHPEYGQQIISCNEQFAEVGKIVRAHHERYNGFGYPDRLRGEEIPLGARIIVIASQYDRIAVRIGEKNSWGDLRERRRQEAIQSLRAHQGATLDPQLTRAFLEMIGEARLGPAPREVELAELRVGMALAGGISGASGMLIIAAGTTLQSFHLARLESFNRIDPITQKIYVYEDAKALMAADR
jgi:response regulator RpfG family c-di-GMP phosphodiesterase